jgi:hypothetical protein
MNRHWVVSFIIPNRVYAPESSHVMSRICHLRQAMLLGLFCFTGCRAFDSSAPVTLPQASEIDAIAVTPDQELFTSGETRRIVDPEKIERFVRFINEGNHAWRAPWHTTPTGDTVVVVEKGDDIIAVYALCIRDRPSEGLLVDHGVPGEADSRLMYTNGDDLQELKSILGVR